MEANAESRTAVTEPVLASMQLLALIKQHFTCDSLTWCPKLIGENTATLDVEQLKHGLWDRLDVHSLEHEREEYHRTATSLYYNARSP